MVKLPKELFPKFQSLESLNLRDFFKIDERGPIFSIESLALWGAGPPLIMTLYGIFIGRSAKENFKKTMETVIITVLTFVCDSYFVRSIVNGEFVNPVPYLELIPRYLVGSLVGVIPALIILIFSPSKSRKKEKRVPKDPLFDLEKGFSRLIPYLLSQVVVLTFFYKAIYFNTRLPWMPYYHFISTAIATIPRFIYGLFKANENRLEVTKRSLIFGFNVGAIAEIVDLHRNPSWNEFFIHVMEDLGGNFFGGLIAVFLGATFLYISAKIFGWDEKKNERNDRQKPSLPPTNNT